MSRSSIRREATALETRGARGDTLPDFDAKRLLFALRLQSDDGNIAIQVYDSDRYVLLDTLQMLDAPGDPHSVLKWGPNGYAFRTPDKVNVFCLHMTASRVSGQ